MEVNPKRYFRTVFLEEVDAFFEIIGGKAFRKISYNIEHAEQTNNPELFKKLTTNIWEFRTKYGSLHYRLLAFWDKTDKIDTLVIATHGLIKKTSKMPAKEIEKAEKIRQLYFSDKNK